MTAPRRMGVQAPDDARQAGDLDAVLSSLPLSLDPRPLNPTLVAVAGTAGWTARARQAARQGAAGILVVEPGTDDTTDDVAALRDTLLQDTLPLVIDRHFAGNPALAAANLAFASADDTGATAEVVLAVPVDFEFAVHALDAMALCAAVIAPVTALQVLTRARTGFVLRGALATGHRCLVTAAATDARPPSATLRRIGATAICQVVIPDPATARPAQVTIATEHDARLLPTVWETSHRASWRRLHRLAADQRSAPDLDAFVDDLTILRTCLDAMTPAAAMPSDIDHP